MEESQSTTQKESLKREISLTVDCVKEASILFDKNKEQFSIKIPKEIVEIFDIKKGYRFRFIVEVREDQEEIKSRFEIIKNEEEKK